MSSHDIALPGRRQIPSWAASPLSLVRRWDTPRRRWIAGGRYDGLIEALGGPHTPAVGWAAGIERLAMLIEAPQPISLTAILAIEDDRAAGEGQRVLATLRRAGFAADMIASGSPRKRYDKAVKVGATVLVSIRHDGEKATARLQSAPGAEEADRVRALIATVITPQ